MIATKRSNAALAELDQLFVQLSREVVHAVREQGLGGLSLSQIMVLKKAQRRGARAQDLSRGLAVSPAAVTKLVDQLSCRGLITRTRSRKDRRSAILAVTPEGVAALEQSERVRIQIIRALLEPLSQEEIAVLTRVLRHLVEVIPTAWKESAPEARR